MSKSGGNSRNVFALVAESEERNFCKAVLHFMNSLRIMENEGDLLHAATVCTDLTNPVTRRYLGEGAHIMSCLGSIHCLVS